MAHVSILRTDSASVHFRELVKQLDVELAIRDGQDHSFYAQFNKIDAIQHVVVISLDGQPVSCGAFKPFDAQTVEVKRMYTIPEQRGNQYGASVLSELELWAKELGYQRTVLETGKKQPEAIRLYTRSGYQSIPNYGQYIGVENSVCFSKLLDKHAVSG